MLREPSFTEKMALTTFPLCFCKTGRIVYL